MSVKEIPFSIHVFFPTDREIKMKIWNKQFYLECPIYFILNLENKLYYSEN